MSNQKREDCMQRLNQVLNDVEMARDIEGSIYAYSMEQSQKKNIAVDWTDTAFCRIYLNKITSICNHLSAEEGDIANENFISRLYNGDIDSKQIAFLTPQELYPENWKTILERKEASDDFLYARKAEVITEQFTCGRCKKNRCNYFQVQLRGADEPMTEFITCINCGNKWKQN